MSDIDGADSIGMGSKISQIKIQKNKLKPNNPRRPNQNYPTHKTDAAKHLYHHT
jgi:hypothetical protein